MPRYSTPGPVALSIDVALGDVEVVASARTATVITVYPVDDQDSLAVQAALATQVSRDGDCVALTQRLPWRRAFATAGTAPSVAICIEVPTGSSLRGRTALGSYRSRGVLDDCDLDISNGDVALDTVGALTVKGSNGNISARSASGDVQVRTSNGAIAIAEVVAGNVALSTSLGGIEVGVRQGTAADLDVRTKLGTVENHLDGVGSGDRYARTVTIHARTNVSDIVIRRAGA